VAVAVPKGGGGKAKHYPVEAQTTDPSQSDCAYRKASERKNHGRLETAQKNLSEKGLQSIKVGDTSPK